MIGSALPATQTDSEKSPASLPLFAQLLGDAFAALPPRVRSLHRAIGTRRYRGSASVTRGNGWLCRLCGWATSLPVATAETPVEVEIATQAQAEIWTRNFGPRAMRSRLWRDGPLLREQLGLATFGFELSVAESVLRWTVREVRVFGLPLPTRWFRGVSAFESERDGRYRFDVRAALPLAGELVHYEGWLAVADE